MSNDYRPPFRLTDETVARISEISELIGAIAVGRGLDSRARLRRENRIRTIYSSLAIENNTLTLDNVTDVIDGKRVLGPPQDIQEVKNAFEVYERLLEFDPYSVEDMLSAHRLLMNALVKEAGRFRTKSVGVFEGERLVHLGTPADLVPQLVGQLIDWIKTSTAHPLVKSCVFHYEFEFIHPFADGNGRMGRMWQTLLLSRWKPVFAWLPVESIVKDRQEEYYAVLGKADGAADSTPFIEFMLSAICDALKGVAVAAQDDEQQTAQVERMLDCLGNRVLSANELMTEMGLKHRQSFRKVYLQPALDAGLVEMTVPEKPNSKNQKYRRKIKA